MEVTAQDRRFIAGERLPRSLRGSHWLFVAEVSAMPARPYGACLDPTANQNSRNHRLFMIPQTYLELVADGLGLSSAEHEVLPSQTVGRDGRLIHPSIPLQLKMNHPQAHAFSAIRILEPFALSS